MPRKGEQEVATGDKRYETSVRVKCSRQFKRELRAVARDWETRKQGKFDMSGVLRVLGNREVARCRRRRTKERGGDGEAAT